MQKSLIAYGTLTAIVILLALASPPPRVLSQPTYARSSVIFANDKIVAVRRVNIVDRELDKDGEWIDARKPFIEIEIEIDELNIGSNLQHIMQIGDRDFASRGTTTEGNLIFHLSLKDYADIKDAELVTYRLGVMRSRETMAKLVSEGRSTSMPGRNLGKLRKAMVDDFAPVDRKPDLERLQ